MKLIIYFITSHISCKSNPFFFNSYLKDKIVSSSFDTNDNSKTKHKEFPDVWTLKVSYNIIQDTLKVKVLDDRENLIS